ncbi:hypothetical protein B0H10DRAFT_890280 [Mycena sp. CBHHK59/15]|nr:hypothetical protein B0H10DRAFT_890280 [Mycena sp. CBHHK59/15]
MIMLSFFCVFRLILFAIHVVFWLGFPSTVISGRATDNGPLDAPASGHLLECLGSPAAGAGMSRAYRVRPHQSTASTVLALVLTIPPRRLYFARLSAPTFVNSNSTSLTTSTWPAGLKDSKLVGGWCSPDGMAKISGRAECRQRMPRTYHIEIVYLLAHSTAAGAKPWSGNSHYIPLRIGLRTGNGTAEPLCSPDNDGIQRRQM